MINNFERKNYFFVKIVKTVTICEQRSFEVNIEKFIDRVCVS